MRHNFIVTAFHFSIFFVTSTISQSDSFDKCYPVSSKEYCFKASANNADRLKMWTEANAWCRNNGGYNLADLSDREVQQPLENFLEKFELVSDNVWIGAQRSVSRNWTWLDGEQYNNTFLSADGNETMETHIYLMRKQDGEVTNVTMEVGDSNKRKRYICRFSGSNCKTYENNFGYYRHQNGHCYVTFPLDNSRATQTWHEARNKCLFEKGDLADSGVLSNSNTLWLQSSTGTHPQEYWIGLRKEQLTWTETGDTVMETRFLNGAPSPSNGDTCIALSHTSRWIWSSRECKDAFLFVCQKVRDSSTTPQTTPQKCPKETTNEDKTSELDSGAIIGIAVGCACFYILSVIIAILIGCYCCRRKTSQKKMNSQRQINAYEETDFRHHVPAVSHSHPNTNRNRETYLNSAEIDQNLKNDLGTELYDDIRR